MQFRAILTYSYLNLRWQRSYIRDVEKESLTSYTWDVASLIHVDWDSLSTWFVLNIETQELTRNKVKSLSSKQLL